MEIAPAIYAINWYMTLLSGYLPFNLNLRVMDIFLNEGWKIIYRAGLAILYIKQERLLKCKEMEDIREIIRDINDL